MNMRSNIRQIVAIGRRANSSISSIQQWRLAATYGPAIYSTKTPPAPEPPPGKISYRSLATQANSSKHNNQVKSNLITRPPIVTIMGHVDHGKTTLLDYLRNSQIVKQEFGGITQHIGAFIVPFTDTRGTMKAAKTGSNAARQLVTFLDTPGHAAFAAMRQRGANVTDMVVLMIACEDGVLDQTVESINYAKNSNVPIIVAINKVDKFTNQAELDKQIEYIRRQLITHDVVTEADGGDVQMVQISALKGLGIDNLKDAILALSESLELKAELNCPATGHIIESSVDPHRGKLCTILVEQGQISKGTYLVAGTTNWAKVRALFDERGLLQQYCGPGQPIQVTGWRENEIPSAGDPVMQVDSEAEAKSIMNKFRQERVEKKAEYDAQQAAERAQEFLSIYKVKLKEKRESGRFYGRLLFTPRGVRPKESATDDTADTKINLVLKCDVDGSLDAMLDLLDTYDKDNRQLVKLDLMHYGVGSITENDLRLAASFKNSVIYGFNVKLASQKILPDAKKAGVNIKLFNVIYHLIDDLKARLAEKMPEVDQEKEIGKAIVMQEFVVTDEKKKKARVAGCRCLQGVIKHKDVLYRLMRGNEEIAQNMQVKTLKHLKDDVKEIEKEKECGISFLDNLIEFKPGDVLICYEKLKVKPKLKWDLRGF